MSINSTIYNYQRNSTSNEDLYFKFIPGLWKEKLAMHLDDSGGSDWEHLAEKLGHNVLTRRWCKSLAQNSPIQMGSPTLVFFEKFCGDLKVSDILDACRLINNVACIDILEVYLKDISSERQSMNSISTFVQTKRDSRYNRNTLNSESTATNTFILSDEKRPESNDCNDNFDDNRWSQMTNSCCTACSSIPSRRFHRPNSSNSTSTQQRLFQINNLNLSSIPDEMPSNVRFTNCSSCVNYFSDPLDDWPILTDHVPISHCLWRDNRYWDPMKSRVSSQQQQQQLLSCRKSIICNNTHLDRLNLVEHKRHQEKASSTTRSSSINNNNNSNNNSNNVKKQFRVPSSTSQTSSSTTKTVASYNSLIPQSLLRRNSVQITAFITHCARNNDEIAKVVKVCKFLQKNKIAVSVDCLLAGKGDAEQRKWVEERFNFVDYVIVLVTTSYKSTVRPGIRCPCFNRTDSNKNDTINNNDGSINNKLNNNNNNNKLNNNNNNVNSNKNNKTTATAAACPYNKGKLHSKLVYRLMKEEYKRTNGTKLNNNNNNSSNNNINNLNKSPETEASPTTTSSSSSSATAVATAATNSVKKSISKNIETGKRFICLFLPGSDVSNVPDWLRDDYPNFVWPDQWEAILVTMHVKLIE
ncbi:hypothetical protein HELRODRAFT_172107 [Helobdella robusta]|uniref:Death domain-containing protein n=1 Tax=Helobdella robusta TaxID=6412 RepID=T1F513_HELRO|nr:hypothetical protein HELRODRAFT_172107 [Helobdella robusta]ESO05089.1 hypothetical protein HELRODRAFT_172107 [Helobdella robusta]